MKTLYNKISQAVKTFCSPSLTGRAGVGLSLLLALTACSDADNPKTDLSNVTPETPVVIDRTTFPKGADVSWLTQMEAEGMKFYNQGGTEKELMTLLKDDCGVNSIRLRVWVNPADGWNNMDDVLIKARRANALGLRLMIDFHFSDTWADPSNQIIPAAWKDYTFDQLKAAVAAHVTTMMNKLKAYDIEPEWVQIGNETRNGMMYQAEAGGENISYGGHYSNGAQFATLVNAGYDAVKAVFPDSKVIVHIDSGNQWGLYSRIFGNLKTNGGKYDIIGISLYPENDSWSDYIASAVSNIQQAYNTYGKDVMVVEFGMDYDQADACKSAITKLMTDGTATGHLAGIFYWEPEAPNGYNGGYKKGCFDGGKPTTALDVFKEGAE